MKIETLTKDPKTGEAYVFLVGTDLEKKEVSIYYLDKNELVNIPDGYYIKTFGDFYFTELYETPYSSYVWSMDKGKTWQKEKMEDFFPVPMPIGYAEDGYIYMLAAMFKGSQEERGARLVIGHPKNK